MIEMFITCDSNIGCSTIKSIKNARKLTIGEIAMCRLIFKDAIDYNTVYILDNQIMNRGASIFGVIIFPAEKKSKDFSKENDLTKQVLFIHEMTHVWQFQKDFPVLLSGAKMQWFYKYLPKFNFKKIILTIIL
jgi:type VI secretion system secreted protein VgrG